MKIKILGSAAGGGFPQWNCACPLCAGLREGTLRGHARTQTQVAFSPVEGVWFLLGASPDLRQQIVATPELAPDPSQGGRSPIAGVFLPSADVDAVLGLLHLREFQSFFVFASPEVQKILRQENRVFRVLDRASPPVAWQNLAPRNRIGCHLSDQPGDPPTFFYSAIPLGGNYPDYAAERTGASEESNLGFLLEQNGKKLFFASSLSGRNAEWSKVAATADVMLLDGTFWTDDELQRAGRSQKMAREMGHLPLSGPDGLLAQFPAEATGRKILIHINNTNPILDEESGEHRAVLDAGFEIAYDGMNIEL